LIFFFILYNYIREAKTKEKELNYKDIRW